MPGIFRVRFCKQCNIWTNTAENTNIFIVTENILYLNSQMRVKYNHKKCSKKGSLLFLIRNKFGYSSTRFRISYASYFCGFAHHLNYIFGNLIACTDSCFSGVVSLWTLLFLFSIVLVCACFFVPCVQ